MAPTLALPSSSFRISTACSSGSIRRSGASMIQRCRASSKRNTICGARRRTVASETTNRSMASARHEGAGWNESRLDISEIECVELRPQHVTLEIEGAQHSLLLRARAGVLLDIGQRKVHILRRLGEPRREVGERLLGDEGVARQHAAHAI